MPVTHRTYTTLAISDLDEFVFGRCPHPLTVGHGLEIGAGTVHPELNFTLPPMSISAATMPEVRSQYAEMIDDACARAVALQLPGLVVEFELLPKLTEEPRWGAEVTAILRESARPLPRSTRPGQRPESDTERPPRVRPPAADALR